jgi:hypothetical protein
VCRQGMRAVPVGSGAGVSPSEGAVLVVLGGLVCRQGVKGEQGSDSCACSEGRAGGRTGAWQQKSCMCWEQAQVVMCMC